MEQQMHTISEWEKNIPFKVELRGITLARGTKVKKAVGVVYSNGKYIMYNAMGEAYALYDDEDGKAFSECMDITTEELAGFLKVRQKEYDIKWE